VGVAKRNPPFADVWWVPLVGFRLGSAGGFPAGFRWWVSGLGSAGIWWDMVGSARFAAPTYISGILFFGGIPLQLSS